MSEKPLISVALDFGTTYSGYAYSTRNDFQKDPSKLFANESWPAGTAGFSKKTPTALLLDPDKNFHSFGYEAEQEYANLAIEGEHKQWYFFRRFKMKLHGEKVICRLTDISKVILFVYLWPYTMVIIALELKETNILHVKAILRW